MASVNVTAVQVGNNPAKLTDGFSFEVTFECVAPLTADLEWRVIYVGSAASPDYDQELDSAIVGPVPIGTCKFALNTSPPDATKIPEEDLIGATCVLITGSYKSHEFIRIGYWVANTYAGVLQEGQEPPKPCPPAMINRAILSDKPRVTRFPIDWR